MAVVKEGSGKAVQHAQARATEGDEVHGIVEAVRLVRSLRIMSSRLATMRVKVLREVLASTDGEIHG